MPVYGKGHTTRYRGNRRMKRRIGKEITRDPFYKPRNWTRPRREYESPVSSYNVYNSTLRQVVYGLSFHLPLWIKERHQLTHEPVNVLDFACGNGRAIRQLSRRFNRGDETMVNAYGYDYRSHPRWVKDRRVKYIHEEAEKLLRYVKDGSMDLIYSYHGLYHYFIDMNKKPEQIAAYVTALSKKLKPGGTLITNISYMGEKQLVEVVNRLGDALPDHDVRMWQKTYYIPTTTARRLDEYHWPYVLQIRRKPLPEPKSRQRQGVLFPEMLPDISIWRPNNTKKETKIPRTHEEYNARTRLF